MNIPDSCFICGLADEPWNSVVLVNHQGIVEACCDYCITGLPVTALSLNEALAMIVEASALGQAALTYVQGGEQDAE